MDGYQEEENHGFKTVEEMQKEQELLENAYNNSYLMLTNRVTMDYVLDASETEFGFVMAHNSHIGPTKMEYENMIIHFIETEEYEKKCSDRKK